MIAGTHEFQSYLTAKLNKFTFELEDVNTDLETFSPFYTVHDSEKLR